MKLLFYLAIEEGREYIVRKGFGSTYYKTKSLKKMTTAALIMVIISLSMISTKESLRIGEKNLSETGEDKNSINNEIYTAGGKGVNSEKVLVNNKMRESVIDVPYIDQSSEYPTGCEVVSATMVLQYYGYNISVDKFIDDYLETSSLEDREGVPWGDHPDKTFIGNPRSSYSYGCFAPVIVKSMNKILRWDMKAKNITGTSLKNIEEYIDENIPVIIWATIDMKPPKGGTDWLLKDSGKRYHWIGGEHCLVLVGYDEKKYYFNDPYNNNGLVAYNKKVVEMRYKDMGKQAIVIKK